MAPSQSTVCVISSNTACMSGNSQHRTRRGVWVWVSWYRAQLEMSGPIMATAQAHEGEL